MTDYHPTTCILFIMIFLSVLVSNTFEKKPPIVCFSKESTDPQVCSGNGNCVANGVCACKTGFYGPQCQFFNCFQIPSGSPLVCSSKGNCTKPNTCECLTGWTGPECNKTISDNNTPPPIVTPPKNPNGKAFSFKVSELNSKLFALSNSTHVELPPTIQKYLEKQGISPTVSISILTTFEKLDEFSSGTTSITLSFNNGSSIPVNGLEDPIQIGFYNLTFHVNSSSFDVNNPNFTCVYFDQVKQEWLTNGVETVISNARMLNNNKTVNLNINCKTNHLTQFTIMDRNMQAQNLTVRDATLSNNDLIYLIVGVSLPAGACIMMLFIMFIMAVCISLCMMKRKKKPKPMVQP